MFAIYDTATGQLVSVGTVVANPLPPGLTAVELAPLDAQRLTSGEYRWNTMTRTPEPDPQWAEAERLETNRLAIDAAIAGAITKLDTLIAAPALGTVPAGTLTTAQLSTALRTLRDGAQATRAGAQDVALILKQTIKLVRGDYDTVD